MNDQKLESQNARMRRLLSESLPQMSPRRRAAVETILAALALNDHEVEELGEAAARFLEERGYMTDGGPVDLAETERLMQEFSELYAKQTPSKKDPSA